MQTKKPNKATIKEQVYGIIKEMILSQEYQLGEKINIDTLAANLNVSNSPIREALTMLEKQGLVENLPSVGFRVISFSPTTYSDICSTLLIIVSGAYELCLRQNTVSLAVEGMRKNLQAQKNIIDSIDMHAALKYALAFDKCIVSATQNAYLLSVYERMEDIFFLMALHIHQRSQEDHTQNIYEHSMILESIEKNDTVAAKEWLLVHYNKHI